MEKKITIVKVLFIITSISLLSTLAFLSTPFFSIDRVQAEQQKQEDGQKFTATLSGDQEVPPVQTPATGDAWIKAKSMQDRIWFKIHVTGIQGVTAAHIHSGKQSENGPPVVTLFKSDTPTQQISGKLVKGNFTQDMLQGPLEGMQLSDLIKAMQNAETYVNVHTQENPKGEIRGQISMISNSTTS